jgi:hypothetical protein
MDALIYADMTTGPTGQRVAFEARITEILRALPARPSGAPSDQPLAPHSGRRGRPDRPQPHGDRDGHRMVMTIESSSACHEWSMPGPHIA